MSVSEYIAKFEELCKFSTIYQHNPNENWKCIKFEGGLRRDILALMGPMEMRDFAALANNSQLVEEYNKKLADTKSDAYRKRLALESQECQHISLLKKPSQLDGHKGKSPQRPIMRQGCPKYGKDHGGRPCLVGQNVCFRFGKPGHIIKDCPHKHQSPTPKPQH